MKAPPIGTMAVASAFAAANIYYNQPMLADMGHTLHVDAHQIGLVATATQAGYALGMPLFVPLGDLAERRALVSSLFVLVACALFVAASAPGLTVLVVGSFCIGLTAVNAQILVPLASDLAPAGSGGRTVGTMMSAILIGILLARIVSGVIAQHFGWRTMYHLAAAIALVLAGALRVALPAVPSQAAVRYREVMRSIVSLVIRNGQLRQICLIAGLFFASFSAFWTTLVFLLERPPYHLGSQAAGLFGLVGVVGAASAPLAGYWSDRKSPRFVVSVAIGTVLLSFIVFWGFGLYLAGLMVGVVVLDAGVQAAQVANQSRVLSLEPGLRNRLNTVYMISYFTGGALGSVAGSLMWSAYGWPGVCATGVACMILAAIALRAR